jgi:proteasome lid subunit RPN8/RPN11
LDPLIELHIPADLWEHMLSEVISSTPEEACGLLAGHISQGFYQALQMIPVTNMLHSPVGYLMAPHEQLAAFNLIEERGWELVGIYHSHPNGPDKPSATDIAEAYYPEAIYLIWSVQSREWKCRGFFIQNSKAREVALRKI